MRSGTSWILDESIDFRALKVIFFLLTLAYLSSCVSTAGRENGRPPRNATQEQYDRWLAFQLAKAEDDLPPSEFNRKHVRPSFRRSVSMPERAVSGVGRGGVTVAMVVVILVIVESQSVNYSVDWVNVVYTTTITTSTTTATTISTLNIITINTTISLPSLLQQHHHYHHHH